MQRWIIALTPLLAAAAFCACSPDNTCTADFDCATNKRCENGKCVAASTSTDFDRLGDGEGGDADVNGDPLSPPSDSSDITGPLLVMTSPTPYQLVHGEVVVVVQATDPSGIDPTRVVVQFAEQWSANLVSQDETNTQFAVVYDTRVFRHLSFAAVVVSAYDMAGNKTEIGNEIALDYRPPVIGLESRPVIAQRDAPGGGIECSQPFDPLGDWSLKHGLTVPPSALLADLGLGYYARVRIQDVAATPDVHVSHWVAGVDPTTTELYILDQAGFAGGRPLVLGDVTNTCNRINPAVLPDANNPSPDQAIVQRLVGVPPDGEPNFAGGIGAPPPGCDSWGSADQPPPRLCQYSNEKLFMWVSGTLTTQEPAVWVVGNYNPDDAPICSGGPMDAKNVSVDGPVCLAVAAADRFGQWSVSPPIVVCVDRDGVGGECDGFDRAQADLIRATQCTDGCTVVDYGIPSDSPEFFYYY